MQHEEGMPQTCTSFWWLGKVTCPKFKRPKGKTFKFLAQAFIPCMQHSTFSLNESIFIYKCLIRGEIVTANCWNKKVEKNSY